MNTHHLKCWPEYFKAIEDGTKPFEVRKEDDKRFEVGDILALYEFEPCPICVETGSKQGSHAIYGGSNRCSCMDTGNPKGVFTKRLLVKRVTYVLRDARFGIQPGCVVMGIADPIL